MRSAFRSLNGAWGLVCVLMLVVVAEIVWPTRSDRVQTAAPPPQLDRTSGKTVEPVAPWIAAILTRPLFNPDRRPTIAASVEVSPEYREDLPRLTGIIVLPSGRQAIFAPNSEGARSIVATEGSQIGAWRVVAIRAEGVQVAGPDGERILRPSYANAPPAVAPPAPAQQTGGNQLLPPAPVDNRPFNSVVQPSGAAIFTNMTRSQAARSPQ
ncbi:hypothetical protein [Acidisphaera sp. L21]|uniref:hypothetical protein n=1 Tax=Acidisphaera sp. L21 TaxID=1641851 RepID=UPI001C204BDE|nr:hypothetical protein [Acidisphaera sp. L21]